MEGGKLPARSYRKRKTLGLWLSADRCRPLGWQGCGANNICGSSAAPRCVRPPADFVYVSVGTDHSGDIQPNELLQAVARQPGEQLTSSAAAVYGSSLKSEIMDLGHGSSG